MDALTQELINCIETTNLAQRPDLLDQAQKAFLDYLGAMTAAFDKEGVRSLERFLDLSKASDKALYYGFASHYLDYDDAQANLQGHFSTVIYSALLAILNEEDSWADFLEAYVVGAELEGIFGYLINPSYRLQGWHPTATVGPMGAAAAIGKLRGLRGDDLASLLSLAATQSSGLALQSGSDGKPLHAGLAARNALWAYELLRNTTLKAALNPFDPQEGWFKVAANRIIQEGDFARDWLKPGQIISPGLWTKEHPYCSAGISGESCAKALYNRWQKGFQVDLDANQTKGNQAGSIWDSVEKVEIHLPPGAAKGMHYRQPVSGREGQFSLEYVVWQVFTYGKIKDQLFFLEKTPADFHKALPKIHRYNDLPKVAQDVRLTRIDVTFTDGRSWTSQEDRPKGSPGRPFSLSDIVGKLGQGLDKKTIKNLMAALPDWNQPKAYEIAKQQGVSSIVRWLDLV